MKMKINFSKIKPGLSRVADFLKKVGSFFGMVFASKAFRVVFLILVLIVAIVQIVFGVLVYKYKAEDRLTRAVSRVVPFPVAVVSYDAVTYNQLLAEKDYIHHFYQSTQQSDVDLAEVDRQILDQLIENRLIAFEARANKIKVSNKEVDAAYEDIATQNGGDAAVSKVLNELYGINTKKFKSLVKTQLLRDKISDQMIAKVKARHILVRVDANAPEDKVSEAKAKIEGLLAEIKNGADFGDIAKKSSEDVGSAEQGGLLEPFAQGEMVDAFSEAAFKTPVGQISDPIRTEFGWHIIKVEAKTGKIEKSFVDWLSDIKKDSLIIKFLK